MLFEEKRAWIALKGQGKLWINSVGYEVIAARPLPKDALTYCSNDVDELRALWSYYHWHLQTTRDPQRLRKCKDQRVKESQLSESMPNSYHKTYGPWYCSILSDDDYDCEDDDSDIDGTYVRPLPLPGLRAICKRESRLV